MINILEKLLSLIYIQPCYFCKSKKDDRLLCKKCYKKIHFLPYGILKEENGCKIFACCIYDDLIKKLIKDFKYHNKKNLALVQAQLMYEYWKNLDIKKDFLIIPVPIHKNRKKERKYNHMDLTADEFSKLTGFKVSKDFIIRTKDTEKQFKLHKHERIMNIKNAFEIAQDKNKYINKESNILIIDDITSTGTTLKEIIKLLNKNGYKNITALALATPDIWN